MAEAKKQNNNDEELDIRILALDFLKNPAGSYRYHKAFERVVEEAVQATMERIRVETSTNHHK
jgi:hypothetical protein